MPVLVVGLNHKSAPLDLLERLAFDADELGEALRQARASARIREAVILSTCNRVEIYAATDDRDGVSTEIRTFLAALRGIDARSLDDHCYTLAEGDAATHLSAVASGIDSMVIGEPQILTQVRRALRTAETAGTVGPTLSEFFGAAIDAAKRARAETGIERDAGSLVGASIARAAAVLGPLAGRTALVVGAGTMAELAASSLYEHGARLLIANRTRERARALATRYDGQCIDFGSLSEGLVVSSIIISSTASPGTIVPASQVAAAMASRPDEPLVIADLAVPRDVEGAAGSIRGVTLFDINDVRAAVESDAKVSDILAVRAIIEAEVQTYLESVSASGLHRLYARKDG